jgi:hypothetical protein
MAERVGGIIQFKINGTIYPAKGNFTYNLGKPKREGIVGSDNRVHGFKETPQIPFIEGEITDSYDLDIGGILDITDSTLLLELSNGKSFILRGAFYAGDGNLETEEGKLQIRFEGVEGEEVK